jgi:hypothetical protein
VASLLLLIKRVACRMLYCRLCLHDANERFDRAGEALVETEVTAMPVPRRVGRVIASVAYEA